MSFFLSVYSYIINRGGLQQFLLSFDRHRRLLPYVLNYSIAKQDEADALCFVFLSLICLLLFVLHQFHINPVVSKVFFLFLFVLVLRSERFLPTETKLPARILPEPEPELLLSSFRAYLSFRTSSPLLHQDHHHTDHFFSLTFCFPFKDALQNALKGGADFKVEQQAWGRFFFSCDQ